MNKLKAAVFAAILCPCFAFAEEPPLKMVSYCPEIENINALALQEELTYLPATTEETRSLDGEPELLVFTTKEPGKCAACDRVRPLWKELQDEYPITPVYCSMERKPRTRGDVVALNYEVEAFPTFVLVVRNADGTADELSRWRGAGTFFDPTDRRIRREFAEAGYKPRVRRDGVKPPPREPRPIPGLNPPKPRPEPPKPSRAEKPGKRAGLPRISFEVDFSQYDLDE